MSQTHGTDLAALLSLLRRRRLALACPLLACLLGALALWRLTPAAYTAHAEVLVTPTGVLDQTNQVTNRQREALNLDTEARIAMSAVVAAKAARLAGTTAIGTPEVSVPPNSSVLSIAVTSADPATAAAHARAYAEAYLAHRAETARAAVAAQLQAVLAKLKRVNAGLREVAGQLETLDKGSAARTLAAHRQALLGRQAAGLTARYDSLKTLAVTPGSVISQPTPPAAPSSPSAPLYLGSGLMLGLLAGTAAAFGRDRLDTRLRTAEDVERLTGLPVLADLSGPADPHELASSLVALCRARAAASLLVRAVPPEPCATLPVKAPLAMLDGSGVHDLAVAEAAALLVRLPRADAREVAAAVRHLHRHDVPVIGAVVTRAAPPKPVPGPESGLGKLVAGGRCADSSETTPMAVISSPIPSPRPRGQDDAPAGP
ncbi:hypothetical protein [Thermoactinospora rubra]|uniref:hypothetical protein n=1 Tax=Thermoactinospora rubra TaxID=1088767 RepID=UPI001301A330|nr:hypothetical protein [Thermoactinospora rubra]